MKKNKNIDWKNWILDAKIIQYIYSDYFKYNKIINPIKYFERTVETFFLCYLFSDGAPNYYPNSFSGPVDDQKYKESVFNVSGDVARWNSADEDNFTQPGIFYRKVCLNIWSGLVKL